MRHNHWKSILVLRRNQQYSVTKLFLALDESENVAEGTADVTRKIEVLELSALIANASPIENR